MKPETRRRFGRAFLYLICFALVFLLGVTVIVDRLRTIHPTYETTRITGPKLPDGSIDYIAAVEKHFGLDVTPENNAAIPILQALGRKALPQNQPPNGITDRLGMPPLPEKGDYFIAYPEFSARDSAEEDPDPTDPRSHIAWPMTITPHDVEWLKVNEKPLALVAQATTRTRYFIPFNGGNRPQTMVSVLIPYVDRERRLRRALLTRALMRLQAGDVNGFADDIRVSHKLARLLGQDSTMIGRMIAFELEDSTCKIERVAAANGLLSAEQSRAMARELAAMGDLPSVIDPIDNCERFMALDAVQVLATAGPNDRGNLFREVFSMNAPDWAFRFFPVRFEASMRVMNRLYDSAIDAAQQPTYSQRMAALDAWDMQIQEMAARNPAVKMLSADWPALMLVPAMRNVIARADVSRMQARLTLVALELSAVKSEQGEYSMTLAEVAPKLPAETITDIFSNNPAIYSRTDNGYVLYSVGRNMTDDGGKMESPADDIVASSP
jgi:hypothetical protein